MEFSDQEKALLRVLQGDAGLSLADVAAQAGMATSTVWRKVQEFEKLGLIRGRVALLDRPRRMPGFVFLRLSVWLITPRRRLPGLPPLFAPIRRSWRPMPFRARLTRS